MRFEGFSDVDDCIMASLTSISRFHKITIILVAVKINGELSKKKMLDENSISAKDYYQKYLSEVKNDCIIARPSFSDTFSILSQSD